MAQTVVIYIYISIYVMRENYVCIIKCVYITIIISNNVNIGCVYICKLREIYKGWSMGIRTCGLYLATG